jgi:hypothetical protein
MSEAGVLNPQIIEAMKQELYYLIRDHCKTYKISDFRRMLYLHDSTRIQFTSSDISELETFISLMVNYWDYFPFILSSLAFEYESENIELSHKVIGTINLQKTVQLRADHKSSGVICSISSKKLFLPENILLGSLILGINLLASKFQEDGREGLIMNFREEHDRFLQQITSFTGYLLKDRTITKLVNHYLNNHENVEGLFSMILQRVQQGKLRERYRRLLSFVRDWKSFSWILNQPGEPLHKAMTPHLDQIGPDKLYEMWIFYKTLTLFEPIKQVKDNVFVNEDLGISVEYHKQKDIGWQLEKNKNTWDIQRYPDISIRIGKKDVVVIDAKCMHYSELPEDEDKQEPAPDRNIVNQMIMYLDYGDRCDRGFVLYADNADRNDVIVKQGERNIAFLNCHPFHDTSFAAFESVRSFVRKLLVGK